MRLAACALSVCAMTLCLLALAGPARADRFYPDYSADRMGYTGPDATLAAAVKYGNQIWNSCLTNQVIPSGSTNYVFNTARALMSRYDLMNLDTQTVRELVRTVWVARQMCPEEQK